MLASVFVYFDRLSINLWLSKMPNGMCKMQIFSGFEGWDLRMWKIFCNFASKILAALLGVVFLGWAAMSNLILAK